jgi:prepilin-type processing-associated H-X9-DG protein
MIELLVVIAVIGLLAALLFPVFGKARERAKSAQCVSNLRQLGSLWQLKRADDPPDVATIGAKDYIVKDCKGSGWPVDWLAYGGGNKSLLVCPSERTPFTDMLVSIRVTPKSAGVLDTSAAYYRAFDEDGQPFTKYPSGMLQPYHSSSGYMSVTITTNPSPVSFVISKSSGNVGNSGAQFDLVDIRREDIRTNVNTSAAWSVTVDGLPNTYGLNMWGYARGDPIILLMDAPQTFVHPGDSNVWNTAEWQRALTRHNGKLNILLSDGRVKAVTPDEIDPTKQQNKFVKYKNTPQFVVIPYWIPEEYVYDQ